MLSTGILGFYISKEKSDSDRVNRQIWNEEITTTTTPKPYDLNRFSKDFDSALNFVKEAPTFLLNFGGKLLEGQIVKITSDGKDEPKSNIYSALKKS